MPKVEKEELRSFMIDREDCRKFVNMPDAELDKEMVEAWRSSPVWAVMSKAIRAQLEEKHALLRQIAVPADAKQYACGYITGLEFLHNRIWEAMLQDVPEELRAGGPSPERNTETLEQTMADIQELEKEFR